MKIELACLTQEEEYSCVPACIRIILRYFGHEVAESEICTACETTERGTGQEHAVFGLRKLGFKVTKLEDAPLGIVESLVRQGKPVIVFLYASYLPYAKEMAGLHAVVVNGVNDERVSFIDPARGEEIEVGIDTFLAAWDERGRLGLVIDL